MTPEVGRALWDAVAALEELGLGYAVVGGLAVGAWGVGRSTRDVDLYSDLPPARRGDVQRALEARGFHVPAMEPELTRFGVFRSRSANGVFLDVFAAVGPLGEAILERRRRIDVGGRPLWLVAPDDLVILKAFSDRERDHEDVVSLAATLGDTLDLPYVRRWAKRLDESIGTSEVSERLERALERAAAASNAPREPRLPRPPKS